MGDPPAAREALARLMGEGLDRHDALHAVGSVVMGIVVDAVHKKGKGAGDIEARRRARRVDGGELAQRMNAMARARTPRELQEAVNRLDEFRRIEDDRRELANLNLKFCVINSLGYERRLYFIDYLEGDARRRIARAIDAELRRCAKSLLDDLAKADIVDLTDVHIAPLE
jgi:hypothetical protein